MQPTPERALVSIFRSPKRAEMYLYLPRPAQFETLPEALRTQFGEPEHVMDLLLTPERTLARVDVTRVLEAVLQQGFYLQMPPSQTSMADWQRDN
ncbi:YcgL domain-containing protein [Saccharospirillum mangrovi]|uniref:YcgL domain-containing protein n=1 Tax=Saccharospirillum mangrovi TaxID=2161747 RepID=UPI000D382FA5|nr:YcgL domain-containing protein [Saccharospirillum mangrovi]